MKKQTNSNLLISLQPLGIRKPIEIVLIVGCLLLTVIPGCSKFKVPSSKHPGWDLQEACGYLDDMGIKAQLNKRSCTGGGKLAEDGKVKAKQSDNSRGLIPGISYSVDPERNVIKLSMSNPNQKEEIFAEYCEKLFQRALGVSMSAATRDAILANQSHLLNIESPKVGKMVIVYIETNPRAGSPDFEMELKIPSKTL